MTLAYKILTADQWAQFQSEGVFTGAQVDLADGYIHMSTSDQLDETLKKHFAGQTELVIATIDLTQLGDALKWEPSRGGALFPHFYDALPIAAVVETRPARTQQATNPINSAKRPRCPHLKRSRRFLPKL